MSLPRQAGLEVSLCHTGAVAVLMLVVFLIECGEIEDIQPLPISQPFGTFRYQ